MSSRSERFFLPVAVEPSGLHGRGVFAKAQIPSGVPVLRCGGRIFKGTIHDPLIRAMQVGPDTFLIEDESDPGPDDFINHSCEPNLGFAQGDLVLWSLREIRAGEELFIHYSTTMNEPGWTIPCDCGTAACRKEVRSFCDLDERQQAALHPIALGYLRARLTGT